MGNSFIDADQTSVIEEFLGMGVHCHYYGLTDEMEPAAKAATLKGALSDYYRLQSNRMSSIASGMHIKTRLWELGYGIRRRDAGEALGDNHHEMLRESIRKHREKLANLEHERWMAYQRVNGWRLACAAQVQAGSNEELLQKIGDTYQHYLSQFKNQNYLMKLHPALVPSHEEEDKNLLLSVEKEMKKRSNYAPGYWESDLKLTDYMIQIVEGAWCKGVSDGVYVKGTVFRAGQLKIERLTDLLHHYLNVYKDGTPEQKTDEEIQLLREKIRQCASGILNNRTGEFGDADRLDAEEALRQIAEDELENTKEYEIFMENLKKRMNILH